MKKKAIKLYIEVSQTTNTRSIWKVELHETGVKKNAIIWNNRKAEEGKEVTENWKHYMKGKGKVNWFGNIQNEFVVSGGVVGGVPAKHPELHMEPSSHPFLLPSLPHSLNHHLPLTHSPPLPHPSPTLPTSPPEAHHRRPQPHPPPPLPPHGGGLRPHPPHPHPPPPLGHLLPTRHTPHRAPLLLGLRLLPLKVPRIPWHPVHHPVPLNPTPLLPPRLPPLHGGPDVLPLASNLPVPLPHRPPHQRLRPRHHVRLLLPHRPLLPPLLEARRHRLPDCPVPLQLRNLCPNAPLPLLHLWMLRNLGLVLQCPLQRLSLRPFSWFSSQELC